MDLFYKLMKEEGKNRCIFFVWAKITPSDVFIVNLKGQIASAVAHLRWTKIN